MFYGLRLASRLRYGDVICIPDSTYALSLVQQPVDVRHRYASIIASVQELLRNTWNVVLKHSLREGNLCADFLTRMGSNSGSAYLELDSPPVDLYQHLLADAMGVQFFRV